MEKITYAVEQRLRMIDFLLSNYRYLNRRMISHYFGISRAQVSSDFKLYKEIAPNNMDYDKNKKIYSATDIFKKKYK